MPCAEDGDMRADDIYDGPCGDMVVRPLSTSEETPYPPSLFPDDGDVNKPAAVPPLDASLFTVGDADDDEVSTPAPQRKRQKAASSPAPCAGEPPVEEEEESRRRKACEESRRTFQKLWTDADEITILEGFREFTSRRGTAHADYQHDTWQFCDQIKGRLQLDFNRSQIVEKLRRLKKKYRNMVARMAADEGFVFRGAHDQATFDIASKIWNPTFKRANRPQDALEGLATPNPPKSLHLYDASEAAAGVFASASSLEGSFDSDCVANIPVLAAGMPEPMEEVVTLPHLTASLQEIMGAAGYGAPPVQTTMLEAQCVTLPSSTAPPAAGASEKMAEQPAKSSFSASFAELLGHSAFGRGISANPLSTSPWLLGSAVPSSELEEKWKRQRILELEVYLKRLDLVHEQVSLKLEKLRSRG